MLIKISGYEILYGVRLKCSFRGCVLNKTLRATFYFFLNKGLLIYSQMSFFLLQYEIVLVTVIYLFIYTW